MMWMYMETRTKLLLTASAIAIVGMLIWFGGLGNYLNETEWRVYALHEENGRLIAFQPKLFRIRGPRVAPGLPHPR